MSSWGAKLDKRIKALADGASKESMQTLANWVCFNRKHAAVFAKTFCDVILQTSTETRQWLYWQILSEVLLANHDNAEDAAKWEKAADLRTTLGEAAVIPALEGLGDRALTDKIEGLWKQWEDHTVFGGPTLIGQIRRQLVSSRPASSASKEEPSSASSAAVAKTKSSSAAISANDTPAPALAVKQETTSTEKGSKVKDTVELDSTHKTTASSSSPAAERRGSVTSVGSGKQRRGSLSSLPGVDIEYDFESKNIPYGQVDSREFLDPCRAVATLQIARDVRNDAPVQINSMIFNLPKDISEQVARIQNGETKVEDLDKATIRDYSIRIPAKLLELDLEEQFQTIKTFQDIVRQQQAAREKLIHLLIKSRCQFGAKEAAQQFIDLKGTSDKLKKRKQLLVDALELEGLDAELDTTDFEKGVEDLAPLSWYDKDASSGGEQKRQRVD